MSRTIAVVGGGPAGLYVSILMKKAWPQDRITVYERNAADDAFGFGVVFSDQTLDIFERYDAQSYQALTEAFAYWDDVAIVLKGETIRVGGNGFCGCSRRTLLRLLQDRARGLGVELHFGVQIDDPTTLDADLVVAADGINSAFRDAHKDHFQPTVDLRRNLFCWLGSTRSFDAFTFFFRETEWGVFIAHCYQYEAGRSTWVIETDPQTFANAGLGDLDEAASARFLEAVFAEELEGHPLITNRSLWRRFPTVRNARWVKDNLVLIGDAKATAHFSIGSGTKLAMEDAIALFEAFRKAPKVDEALALYEQERRLDVEKTQHAADVSLVWFEHLKRFWDYDPRKFAFGLMTRAKAITYDNLALRAPAFVEAITRAYAEEQALAGHPVRDLTAPPMFQPFRLRDMTLANRVVMSPMCTYSASDGLPGDFHLVHLGSRAMGGAGLIYTEMTAVSPQARISPGCAGMYTDAQETAWTRIVDFVHANSAARICLQLGHAGRKGATRLMWDGMDQPIEAEDEAWPILSASPEPYYPHSRTPAEITRAQMEEVRDAFVASTRRAVRAGFDMVELHCAHGYLLASFLSPLTNRRTDDYGGSVENRLRWPLEVFEAMRAAWPVSKPMAVRLSATDWKEGGLSEEDALAIARAFAQAGCDLVDVSTGQTVHDSAPQYGRMFQTPYSDAIRNEAKVATQCVGAITSADQINTILAAGRADLVAVGRTHMTDPFLTMNAAAWYGVRGVHCPKPYLPGQAAAHANLGRARDADRQLRLAARPRSRK